MWTTIRDHTDNGYFVELRRFATSSPKDPASYEVIVTDVVSREELESKSHGADHLGALTQYHQQLSHWCDVHFALPDDYSQHSLFGSF